MRVEPSASVEDPPPDDERPFVLALREGANPLLVPRRIHRVEVCAARAVARLARAVPAVAVDAKAAADLAQRLMPGEGSKDGRAAIRHAVRCPLTVVTGGPGTGKTYTVQRLLAVLVAAAPEDRPLRIAVAAPTGKAAARLTESLTERLDALDVDEDVRRTLEGLRGRTLHDLLRIRPDGTSRYGRGAPLPADVVVVDEVSMVDLFLLRRLLEALEVDGDGKAARLVLLGDPDQLASVDVGTVLADLVDPAAGLGDHVTTLSVSHRFRDAPSIADLAAAIRAGDLDRAMARLEGEPAGGDPEPARIRHVHGAGASPEAVFGSLTRPLAEEGGLVWQLRKDRWRNRAREWLPADDDAVRRALDALERYRVLAAYRRGRLGSERLARDLAAFVVQQVGLPARTAASGAHAGAVVLVTRNDPRLDLRNGDVGLVLPDGDQLAAFFPAGGGVRRILASNLPPWEPGGAMTVHKSQGSQFDRVAFVVGDRAGPLLSRELVYTAVTRARRRLDWYGDRQVVATALARRVARASDLARLAAAALRAPPSDGAPS